MDPLRVAMAHEYRRCRQALDTFASLARTCMSRPATKEDRLDLFDAYASFLHHLYEFVLAAVEDQKGRRVEGAAMDAFLSHEIEKVRKIRLERIVRGDAPSSQEAAILREPIPPTFARDLRDVRNCVAHAKAERAGPGAIPSLAEFYRKHHAHSLLLLEEEGWFWHVRDVEAFDWGRIEEFAEAVIGR